MFLIKKPFLRYHPFTQFLILIMAAFSLGMLCTFLSYFVLKFAYNIDLLQSQNVLYTYKSANPLRIYLALSNSLGLFGLPAFWFLSLQNDYGIKHLFTQKIDFTRYLSLFLLMIVATPVVYFAYKLNKAIELPAAFHALETFMKNMELEAEVATETLLKMPNVSDFLLNILVVALLPAIAEELFFRGAMQQIFFQLFRHKHLTIWVVAILFSALHLQFYGFFPRMFLGAMFGYLYLWSGNILVPILAHFINNAGAVILAYLHGKNLIQMQEEDLLNAPVYVYATATLATVALLRFMYQKRFVPRVM